mmetsp:Transcript_26101/g.34273  ORF Transcript_26101/g.34273 Transcript_26101/m.34273 type:complete len:458 (-) Transcript_26101:188-1561(-)
MNSVPEFNASWSKISVQRNSQEFFREVGKSIGIPDIDAEPFLMWVVRERIFTPLPPIWKEIQSSFDGSNLKFVYQNTITQQISEEHPATDYFKSVVETERKQFSPTPSLYQNDQNTEMWDRTRESSFIFSQSQRHSHSPQRLENSHEGNSHPEENQEGEWECKFCHKLNLMSEEQCGLCLEAKSSEGIGSIEQSLDGIQGLGNPIAQEMSDEQWSAFIAAEEKRARELGISNSQMILEAESSEGAELPQQQRSSKKVRVKKPKGLSKLTSDRVVYKSSPSLPPPMPVVLEFYSWWRENSAGQMIKRGLTLVYHYIEDNFMVQLDGSEKIYTISHIMGKYGPVEVWDLHVGAALDVLGRRITLHSAERTTAQWLDKQATWYIRVAEALEKALYKHGSKAKLKQVSDRLFAHQNALQIKKVKGKGYVNLRKLRTEIEEMKLALSEIRPQLAQKLTKDMA